MYKISRKMLRSGDAKRLLIRFNGTFKTNISLHSRVELFSIGYHKVYVTDTGEIFLEVDNYLIPSLKFDQVLNTLPQLKVDRGAIPHICSGADLMAPGVKGVSRPFHRSEMTVVVDNVYGKSLAVGIALIDSQEFDILKKGKVVKNLHYTGDAVWDFIKRYNLNTT